jgi:hypothetical protein
MVCFVVVFLPILPLKAVHTYDWNGDEYRAIPIRWSFGLVAQTFVRRWLAALIVPAVIFGIMWVSQLNKPGNRSEVPTHVAGAIAGSCLGLMIIGLGLMKALDGRNRAIRRVLGPHQFGSSDPATWTEDLLSAAKTPKEMFETSSYAQAVRPMLAKGDFAEAMWAARLTVAREDATEGERLTDEILGEFRVLDAIARVNADPNCWATVMRPTKPGAGTIGAPPEGAGPA